MKTGNMHQDSQGLKDSVWRWADHIGVEVREVHIRQMRRKWASISTHGRLTLNTEVLDLPTPLVEFIIVHELVHLLVPNHGKLFKGYMSAYLPDWQERQKCLKEGEERTLCSRFYTKT